jgi:ribosome maturation factor RimP
VFPKRAKKPSFFYLDCILGVELLSDTQLGSIRQFAEEVAEREGCLLYDIEFHDGPARSLRVYIDKSTGGVSIDDCANVSRGLNLRLDVEDIIPGGRYDLEVSSPGLDRKLTQLWHFTKVIGQRVRMKYWETGAGPTGDEQRVTRPYEGELKGVDGTCLSFENAKGLFDVEFADVQKARIMLAEVMAKKPMPGKKKR